VVNASPGFSQEMKIALGCDHAGFQLKKAVLDLLSDMGHEVLDSGTDSPESVDYPDFAHAAAERVKNKEADAAIVICGSGIGVSISANKVSGIRCALCLTPEMATLAREHNNANALAMGARFISEESAREIVSAFIKTPFEGGRHERRVEKIHKLSDC